MVASVPATTTLWCSKAETIWPAQVMCRLHPCFLSLASILASPARFRSGWGGPGDDDLQSGVMHQPGPRWWQADRPPQHAPMIGRLLVESTQALLVIRRGPVEAFRASRPRVVTQCSLLPTLGADQDLHILVVHFRAAFCCVGAGPARGQASLVPTPAKDLTLDESSPLSAVTSAWLPQVTLCRRIIYGQRQDIMPTATGPAPDHPGSPTR